MNEVTHHQLFWICFYLWALFGGIAWMFHSGKKLLLKAKNPFQMLYRAFWFGPAVLLVSLIIFIDRLLGLVPFLAESKKQQQADEEEAKNVSPID